MVGKEDAIVKKNENCNYLLLEAQNSLFRWFQKEIFFQIISSPGMTKGPPWSIR